MARVTIESFTRQAILNGQYQMKVSAKATQYERAGKFSVEIKAGEKVWVYGTQRADGQFTFVPDLSLLEGFTTETKVLAELTVRFYENGIETGSATETVELRAVPSMLEPEAAEGWVSIRPYHGDNKFPENIYVKNSMFAVSIDPSKVTFKYGAKARNFRAVCSPSAVLDDFTEAKELFLVLPRDGEVTITCAVRDTRGYEISERITVTAYTYMQPAISNIDVFRADASGTSDENGAYIAVQADAGIADLGGNNRIGEFIVTLSLTGSTDVITERELTSGEPALIGGSVVPARSYRVMIRLTDISGGNTTYTAIIPTMSAAFNIMPGGKGAAFNHLAEQKDALDITGWDLMARGVKMDDIYLTAGNYDPAIIFGGTWTEVSNTSLPFHVWQRIA